MKRDLILAGIVGVVLGVAILIGSSTLSERIPILLQGAFAVGIAFAILFFLALLEIPVMVFGLRQMVHSPSTPRKLLIGVFAFYVSFAAVYAAIFILLTGQTMLGETIAALCGVRLASMVLIK